MIECNIECVVLSIVNLCFCKLRKYFFYWFVYGFCDVFWKVIVVVFCVFE